MSPTGEPLSYSQRFTCHFSQTSFPWSLPKWHSFYWYSLVLLIHEERRVGERVRYIFVTSFSKLLRRVICSVWFSHGSFHLLAKPSARWSLSEWQVNKWHASDLGFPNCFFFGQFLGGRNNATLTRPAKKINSIKKNKWTETRISLPSSRVKRSLWHVPCWCVRRQRCPLEKTNESCVVVKLPYDPICLQMTWIVMGHCSQFRAKIDLGSAKNLNGWTNKASRTRV